MTTTNSTDSIKRGDLVVALLSLSARTGAIADPALDRHTGDVHDPVAVVAELNEVATVVGRLIAFAAIAKNVIQDAETGGDGTLFIDEEDADALVAALDALGFDPSAVDYLG